MSGTIRFVKAAALYFLILAIPGIAAGLFGEWAFWDFWHTPTYDDDGNRVENLRPAFAFAGLIVLLVSGTLLLPGYYRQYIRPHEVSRRVWQSSAAYNFLLLGADTAFMFSLGWPHMFDWSICAAILVLFGPPFFGLVVSIACLKTSRGPTV